MKIGNRTGEDLVERYCPRLDKNVTVYPNTGETIGYTCMQAETCDVKHCFMAAAQSPKKAAAEQRASLKQCGQGESAASTELLGF